MKAIKTIAILSVIAATQCDTITYTCGKIDSDKKYCAQLNSTVVTLDASACDYSTEYCPVENIGGATTSVNCATGSFSKVYTYLGESCKTDDECKTGLANSKCDAGICKKIEGDEKACTSDNECSLGFYCKDKTTCEAQKDENTVCTSNEECKNSFGCFNGKCTKYSNFGTGTTFTYLPDNKDILHAVACTEGLYPDFEFKDRKENEAQCVEPKYKKDDKPDGEVLPDQVKECIIGTQCIFFAGTTQHSEACLKSYNAGGKNYCHIFGNYFKFNFRKIKWC
jgi:hypothetical protein